MSSFRTDYPWLPATLDNQFSPLEHFDTHPSTDTPLVVTPRGGAREVGRSCYQVNTEHATYLVDCGLNQGSGDSYPMFHGLEHGDIDAVFLTHAHIDHSGGLPVLEARNLLDDDAVIFATQPTIRIATLLLQDSLKIHRREANAAGSEQIYTKADVDSVLNRFEPVEYGGGLVSAMADAVPRSDTTAFQFGNAAHLLGSAWLALTVDGYRVVFSGDIGNRVSHLPDLQPPLKSDLLISESTYGSTHSHTSLKDAQTEFFRTVKHAVGNNEPVLIPTFAVGRAQLLQLLFSNRLHMLSGDVKDRVQLVIDGMAQDATDIYHEFVTDESYVADSITNAATESGITEPFDPDGALYPSTDSDRAEALSAPPERIPIVIAPSGMLTGGNSPRYLTEFAARYDSAKVILTGYQAVGTGGRQLQNGVKADEQRISFETDASPINGADWPSSDQVRWITRDRDDGGSERVTRAMIPQEWVETVTGLSGHAAQQGLRDFARRTESSRIALVHGPPHAQEQLAEDFASNIDSADEVLRARMLTPIPVNREIDVNIASLTPDHVESDRRSEYGDRIDALEERLAVLSEELSTVRQNAVSPDEVKSLLRDEQNLN